MASVHIYSFVCAYLCQQCILYCIFTIACGLPLIYASNASHPFSAGVHVNGTTTNLFQSGKSCYSYTVECFLHSMVIFMVAVPLVFSTSHVKMLPKMGVRSLLTRVSTLL